MKSTDETMPARRTNQDELRWRALENRQVLPQEDFVYAVTSTGIYCRPGCPSRLPRRENVRFYATGRLAEQAGFRPCAKCRPDSALSAGAALTLDACKRIHESYEMPAVADLALSLSVSPRRLREAFTKTLGITPKQYMNGLREQRFLGLLRNGGDIAAAVYEAGYSGPGRVYERAVERFGMTPASYRAGGRGARLHYLTLETALGRLLVAGTAQGVTMIGLGDSDDALIAGLRAAFGQADIRPAGVLVRCWGQCLSDYISGDGAWPLLPTDIRASAFQIRVWWELRLIPPGEALTYGDIAARLGQPDAARAVGNACAANPCALAIPCHRAIPAKGGSGRYRWGRARKARLLTMESAAKR